MIVVSSGSNDLNSFLNGGYEPGIISMIAGAPGTGKTNFCILAACSCANSGKKVIFLDSEGGFSLERVKQIVGNKYSDILENFFILNPNSFNEQKECFNKIGSIIKKGEVGLIIVDSMTMLYRLEIGEDLDSIKKINLELAKQMRILSEISKIKKIPVIITNQIYHEFDPENSFSEKRINLVGGDLLKYWSKCILLLENSVKRKAVLLKHRCLPKKEMGFEITNKGIFKRGIF